VALAGGKAFKRKTILRTQKKIKNTVELACSMPFARFAHLAIAWVDAGLRDVWIGASTKRSFQQDAAGRFDGVAQSMRHPAVDDLHSIDFAADTRAGFLLTPKMKGVKTNSFFDSF
jgi:hypothetical protein